MKEHDPAARLPTAVPARVQSACRHVHRLPGPEPKALACDLHLELAPDDVDRLGFPKMTMGRQRPARRRLVDQQAEPSTRLLGTKADFGTNPTRHPNHLSVHRGRPPD